MRHPRRLYLTIALGASLAGIGQASDEARGLRSLSWKESADRLDEALSLASRSEAERAHARSAFTRTTNPLDAFASAMTALDSHFADAIPEDLSKWGPFVETNWRLHRGRSLVRQGRLEQAEVILDEADARWAIDPASLAFHQAVCHHGLGKAGLAGEALDRFEAVADAPVRYRALASRMRQSLSAARATPMDGIARDTWDVWRRLDAGLVDDPLLARQEEILRGLDRLIEEKESAKPARGAPDANRPLAPADESRLLQSQGEGKVGGRTLADGPVWGKLSARERQAALQGLDRDFSPHYRRVVEAYFRRLADTHRDLPSETNKPRQ